MNRAEFLRRYCKWKLIYAIDSPVVYQSSAEIFAHWGNGEPADVFGYFAGTVSPFPVAISFGGE
ncbi:MAG: hypothetical protein CMK32_07890 [Porticoccaceae bacterium]|nr:hypothetical protein [Porticoccaceae bacterium]